MLFGAIVCIIIYAGLTLIEKLNRKEELKKAKDEGYDVWIHA